MQIPPLVSVVVTYFNEGTLLFRALNSIAAQSCSGMVEVVIVDDCSTIPVPPIESTSLAVRVFRTPHNLYAGGARNFGARQTSGTYLMFLDADDEYCPGRIEAHVNFLKEHPDVVMVGSTYWTEENNQVRLRIPEMLGRYAPKAAETTGVLSADVRYWACVEYCCNTGAITFEREKFLSLGGFREDLRWGEEWELQARAARCGRIGFIASPSYRYICRSNTVTSTVNPAKYKSLANILRTNRQRVPDLPGDIVSRTRIEERRAWLLACQLYLEHKGDAKSAFRSAAMALSCGPDVWSVRSFVRSTLWLVGEFVKKICRRRNPDSQLSRTCPAFAPSCNDRMENLR
jgi:glycosyltransferase involved in cell wall biosynthesis